MRLNAVCLAICFWCVPRPAAAEPAPDDALATLVDDNASTEAHQAAVRLLSRPDNRSTRVFRALIKASLDDLSSAVRQDAALALLDYEDNEVVGAIDAYLKQEMGEEARLAVCVALATAPAHLSDRGATNILRGLLANDTAKAVRLAAVQGLTARQDGGFLSALKRAAKKDTDPEVRAAAARAYIKLAALSKPKVAKKPKPPAVPPYDAVKGKDNCPARYGWCECFKDPLKTKPHCVPREDCEHSFFNSYRSQGFSCSWNGEDIE